MPKNKAVLIFNTTDYFGNLVGLWSDTWDTHIIDPVFGHPEMAGYQGLVQDVLQDPYEICPSTESKTGLAYISDRGVGPRPEGIRVLVDYRNTEFEKGSTSGTVTTAYPVDVVRYARPKINLRRPIYRKKR